MWITVGAVFGLLAVVAGALRDHALAEYLTAELTPVYDTAGRYHFQHALALLAVGLLALRVRSWLVHAAGVCFLLGILVFSGSLYALSLSGFRALGMLTPMGGVLFLTGWLFLALCGIVARRNSPPAPVEAVRR